MGDLCILLAASEIQVLHEVRFVRIDACAAPLDLRWSVEGGVLSVLEGRQGESGLGLGQVPHGLLEGLRHHMATHKVTYLMRVHLSFALMPFSLKVLLINKINDTPDYFEMQD